ncbi:MAG: GtrA family protein [Bacillota bacterium]
MAGIKKLSPGSLKDLLNYEKNKQVVRFGVVGVTNTAVDYAVYSLCIALLGIHYSIAQLLGYSFGIINSFILNRIWTFKSTNAGKKTSRQFVQFVLVNAVSLGITLLGLNLLVEGLNISEYLAKLAVIVVAQVVNFFGYKLWVFKK